MKTNRYVFLLLIMLAALTACTSLQKITGSAGHPKLSEQDMLIACSECHQKATPQVYTEWYASTHGLGNVKCYQCHGTYEALQTTPDMAQSCGSCHADKLGAHTGDQTCWECHSAHNFSVN